MMDDKEHVYEDGFPHIPGMTVLPWAGWFLIVVMLILALWAGKVFAEPMAVATVGNGEIVITVYTEDCQLTDIVSNLPKRATWLQKGKTFEGCVGVQPEAGVAFFYFKEDRTVAVVPLQVFSRVTGV